ncbi:hypothetical protein BH09BAC1_BH09BAC1_04180 [soil metagenome]
MRLLLLLGLFIIQISEEPRYVAGIGYQGYVFPKEYNTNWLEFGEKIKYNPTDNDILLAEKLLAEEIPEMNKKRDNQGKGCPIIDKELHKYMRQYFGYIDSKFDTVIWINCVYGNDNPSDASWKELIMVDDGCSHYWSIEINITQGYAYNLFINGSA